MKRALRLLLLVLTVALIAAACGDSGAAGDDVASVSDLENANQEDPLAAGEGLASDSEPVGDTEIDQEQAMLAFTQCMRDEGVDMDDPTVDADGNLQFARPRGATEDGTFDRETVDAARETCSEFLEGVTLARREGLDRTEIEDTLVVYAACMRDNDFDMPDPDFSNFGPGQGGGGGGPFGQVDQEDPAFVAADAVCRSIFTDAGLGDGPGRGGFGRPGGGGGDE